MAVFRKYGFKIAAGAAVILSIYAGIANAADLPDDKTIIAVVRGEIITYGQIKPSSNQASLLKMRYFRGHGREMPPQKLKKGLEDLEKNLLAGKIRQIITDAGISELGLRVADEEVEQKLESMFAVMKSGGISPEDYLKEVQHKGKLMVEALTSWQKNPRKSETIHKQLLASENISGEEWELWRINYDTPEKIKKLQDLIPKSVEDMKKNSFEAVRNDILRQKLREHLSKDSAVGNDELKAYYETKKTAGFITAKFDEIKGQLHGELLERKKYEKEREWLRERYRKAKIEIKDERFKDVLEMHPPTSPIW